MLSFVIPTYKNNKSLYKCVECIFNNCKKKSFEFEIIVVDNYESDDYVNVLTAFKDNRLQILKNPKLGAHYSRRLGLSNSVGDFIVFVDDDNYLTEAYIDFIIEKSKTNYDIFIGCASKEYNKIDWGKLKFDASSYACGSLENVKFKAGIPVYWGAGMCMNKVLAIKAFKDDLIVEGRVDKGNYIMSGEDHEISLRAFFLGAKCIYFKNIGLYHDFNLERLNSDYYNKLQTGFKFASWQLKIYYLRNNKNIFSQKFKVYFIYNFLMSIAYNIKHPFGYESKLFIKDAFSVNTIRGRFNSVKEFI